MRTKKWNMMLSCLFIIMSLIGGILGYFLWQFYQVKPQSISKNAESILFYRSDCEDCRRIYPIIVQAKLEGKSIQCINLKSNENRHYIEEYGVVKVPTLMSFSSHHEYQNSWLGVQDIRHHLEKKKEE